MQKLTTSDMLDHFRKLSGGIHMLVETVPLRYQIFLLRAELEVKQAELHAMDEEATTMRQSGAQIVAAINAREQASLEELRRQAEEE